MLWKADGGVLAEGPTSLLPANIWSKIWLHAITLEPRCSRKGSSTDKTGCCGESSGCCGVSSGRCCVSVSMQLREVMFEATETLADKVSSAALATCSAVGSLGSRSRSCGPARSCAVNPPGGWSVAVLLIDEQLRCRTGGVLLGIGGLLQAPLMSRTVVLTRGFVCAVLPTMALHELLLPRAAALTLCRIGAVPQGAAVLAQYRQSRGGATLLGPDVPTLHEPLAEAHGLGVRRLRDDGPVGATSERALVFAASAMKTLKAEPQPGGATSELPPAGFAVKAPRTGPQPGGASSEPPLARAAAFAMKRLKAVPWRAVDTGEGARASTVTVPKGVAPRLHG